MLKKLPIFCAALRVWGSEGRMPTVNIASTNDASICEAILQYYLWPQLYDMRLDCAFLTRAERRCLNRAYLRKRAGIAGAK